MDWISVVDTAVKIGFGALIGGFFAIWTQRLSQRHEQSKLQLERRRVLLQEAQIEVSHFAGSVSTYWANTRNAVFLRDKGDPVTAKMRTELQSNERTVFEGFAELSASRGKILLLGESSAVDALAQFHDACSEFFQIAHIDNVNCTVAALDGVKGKIVAKRTVFYDRMAEAYARIPEVR